jgi:predicted naringenin-chalcone synthase
MAGQAEVKSRRYRVTKALIISALALAGLAFTASSARADPTATVAFQLTQCELTITSTKDISNINLNGVKTEGFADGTTTLVIGVEAGDMIEVKAGITRADFAVTGCLTDNDDGFD